MREPSFAEAFAALWASEPLEDWKAWLGYHVISDRAPYLSDDLVEANFDFYGRTLTGAQELRDRWKRGVSLVQGVLGEAVGKVYVERHFPPAHKARMEGLVANLVAAYRESISQLDWMGEETRAKALAKLEAFTPKIGYPARWRDYSSLEVSADDLVGNVRRAYAFEQDRELAKIGKPIDRDEWFMTPQTVNAYYNPGHERDRVPGRDPAAAVLRRRRRRRRQLRRDRRGHRPRDRPRVRRPGLQVRRRRAASRTGGRPTTAPSSRRAPRR